jgi:hypothetical protein
VVESQQSRSQQDKIRKLRRKAQVVVDHVDIIKDEFGRKDRGFYPVILESYQHSLNSTQKQKIDIYISYGCKS